MIRSLRVGDKLAQLFHKREEDGARRWKDTSAYTPERGQLWLASAAFCLAASVLFSIVSLKNSEEALSSRIAPQVLRFHVLANSDSSEDQKLKMEVKKLMLDTMYAQLNQLASEASKTPFSLSLPGESKRAVTDKITKADISLYIETHKTELEKTAEEFIAKRGYSYPVSIRLEKCFFPTKIYGDVTFPCGSYDAVRVLIGEGEGKNWWCVLYPPLCFTDNSYAEVPDSSKEKLKGLLDEDDFQALMKNRRVVFGEGAKTAKHDQEPELTVRVRLRLPRLLSGGN